VVLVGRLMEEDMVPGDAVSYATAKGPGSFRLTVASSRALGSSSPPLRML
jgi:hypothetical protein